MDPNLEKATFAGGCFWCTEADLKKIDGVHEVFSGYTGGETEDPTYEEVCSGTTGHTEAVQVIFDPEVVSYETLLDIFFRHIDPTDEGGQFADRGTQYRTGVFYHNSMQKQAARNYINQLNQSGVFDKKTATELLPFQRFYYAESYHQNFYKTNPMHYRRYREASGRNAFIKKHWESERGRSFKPE